MDVDQTPTQIEVWGKAFEADLEVGIIPSFIVAYIIDMIMAEI